MHLVVPFIILSLAALQRYYHFNEKRQKEKGKEQVEVVPLHDCHSEDAQQRDEDEQQASCDRTNKLEYAQHADGLR